MNYKQKGGFSKVQASELRAIDFENRPDNSWVLPRCAEYGSVAAGTKLNTTLLFTMNFQVADRESDCTICGNMPLHLLCRNVLSAHVLHCVHVCMCISMCVYTYVYIYMCVCVNGN